MLINTVEELEDALSAPSAEDVASVSTMSGDILILGVAGKMGPTLAKLVRRAVDQSKRSRNVTAVSRFSDLSVKSDLEKHGIKTISRDLLEPGALNDLPDIENVIFMAGRKFGTEGEAHLTWAANTFLPGLVAQRYRYSRIIAFSTGNVYGLEEIDSAGADEETPTAPVGEYAQAALGRERMFEYGSSTWRTPVVILRLNYAVELRYGVLVDIALNVFHRRPVDLRTGCVNVIWQRDANSVCLRSLAHCQSPPLILNLTGPETLSVRWIAQEFGTRFSVKPTFAGQKSDRALISNASKAHALFGKPSVTPAQMMDWIAHWITTGGKLLNKPTLFEAQDGKF
ncbi:MAG TPA: NAD-dependent epimerase/dehydratase family protein [Terriglobales bacterium]|nr:NAD-dependent epimerase/dehydratase family protein [Terriglobales bacterium]